MCIRDSWYTSEKAERELGYRISSVDDAIRDAWDWFVANGYVKGMKPTAD